MKNTGGNRTVDLSECEREPIHLLGQIQPYGILMVLDEDGTILQTSANAATRLGLSVGHILGAKLETLIRDVDMEATLDAIRSKPEGDYRRLSVLWRHSRKPMALDVVLHRKAGRIIVEFLPTVVPDAEAVAHLATVADRTERQVEEASGFLRVAQIAAGAVAEALDYHRVMIYRFHDDWSGEVIAERRAADLAPYLGLRYPASDIPAQARALYRQNLLRVIVDVDRAPVGLMPPVDPETGLPPDLGNSILRSVSHYHIEYLRNMNVEATLTASILVDGDLWGMIACHHRTPKPVPWHEQAWVGRLAATLGRRIGALVTEERTVARQFVERHLDRVERNLAGGGDSLTGILFGEGRLGPVIDAAGTAIVCGDRIIALGMVPPIAWIGDLARWIAERAQNEPYATATLPTEYPAACGLEHFASGLLATVITRTPLLCIIAFRGEFVHEIHWGGDPGRPAIRDESGRLSPRRSFDLWRETVQGTSRPWQSEQVAIMAGVGAIVRKVLGPDDAAISRRILQDANLWAVRIASNDDVLRLLLDLVPDTVGIVLWRPDPARPVVARANSRFCVTFGVTADEVENAELGPLFSRLGLSPTIAQEDASAHNHIDVWSTGIGQRTLLIDRHDMFQITGSDIVGRLSAITFTDVTRNRRVEEALGAARMEAERATTAKNRFLAAVSHDLRQPLQAAQLFLTLLESRNRDPLQRELLQKLRAAQENLGAMIDALVEFSRFESGAIKAEMTMVGIETILGDVIAEARPNAEAKGLEMHYVRSSLIVRTDPRILTKILRTLIMNAILYTPAGKVLIGVHPHGAMARVVVADSGIGIAAEHMNRIFDEFYQVENPERDRRKGLGIGLPIARRMAAVIDAEISVRSTLGKGSAFIVSVPLATVRTADRPLGVARKHRLEILLLTDDQTIRRTLGFCISAWGYRSVTATKPSDALSMLDSGEADPAVLIVDAGLPTGMDGIEVIDLLRRQVGRGVPAVLILGEGDASSAEEKSFTDLAILKKPIDPTVLQTELARMLARAPE